MNTTAEDSGQPLVGTALPRIALPSSTGAVIDLADASLGSFVLFIYPRTGRPDRPEAADWGLIPGAKGCTAESCEFRDLAADFRQVGLGIYGLSTQDTADQQEAARRLHLPYPLLSDPAVKLGRALGLATFAYDGIELYKRSTLVVADSAIVMAELEITDGAAHPRDLLATLSAGR